MGNAFLETRLRDLLAFDRQHAEVEREVRQQLIPGGVQLTLFSEPSTGIIGVDEVGRGCLAGPVMAGAVMLPFFAGESYLGDLLKRLNDSKQLTGLQRINLAQTIRACSWFAVGSSSPQEIDQMNILEASHLAMKRAVDTLISTLPDNLRDAVILVDGAYPIRGLSAKQVAVPKGDTKSASIAAASVVAKVHRDTFMLELAKEYDRYGWSENKGYPSEEHRNAVEQFGKTHWHRKSFRINTDKQLTLRF